MQRQQIGYTQRALPARFRREPRRGRLMALEVSMEVTWWLDGLRSFERRLAVFPHDGSEIFRSLCRNLGKRNSP